MSRKYSARRSFWTRASSAISELSRRDAVISNLRATAMQRLAMGKEDFSASAGLPVLGPPAMALFHALDRQFLRWADACGAIEKQYSVLMRVSDLARFDYFRNFPHIALCTCSIRN